MLNGISFGNAPANSWKKDQAPDVESLGASGGTSIILTRDLYQSIIRVNFHMQF